MIITMITNQHSLAECTDKYGGDRTIVKYINVETSTRCNQGECKQYEEVQAMTV